MLKFYFLTLSFFCGFSTRAQNPNQVDAADSIRTENESWKKTFWEDLRSPLTTPARWVLLGGSAVTLSLLLFQDKIVDPTQSELADERPLGKWHKLGNWGGALMPNIGYFSGMLLYAWIAKSPRAYQRSLLMFKTTAYSVVSSTLLKATIREPRPKSPQEKTSFPSGHTTTAFAFASVVAAEHAWYWGVPAYALATLTAIARINDNRHFLHDVVAGATIGASYGIGLYYRSHSSATETSAQRFKPLWFANFLPNDDFSGARFNVSALF